MTQFFNWYQGFIRGKTRIIMAWVFVFSLVFFTKQTPRWEGALICFLGSLVRFWASGFLKKNTSLTFEGPYSWVRNPLYLGTYLMALGALVSLSAYVMSLLFLISFFFIYHFVILEEEKKLTQVFGDPYLTYMQLVCRFFPLKKALSDEQKKRINPVMESWQTFSWSTAMDNKAFESLFSFLGIFLVIFAVYFFKQGRLF
jgi:protein-S-isoprenylcysteine O-methyltransferase Ste14